MPYLIIGAALLLLVLAGKGSGIASPSSASKSAGIPVASIALAAAKKLLSAGGTAAVAAGGVAAGGAILTATPVIAGSLPAGMTAADLIAAAPAVEVPAGSGAVAGEVSASAGIGTALATAGLLALPFGLGPVLAKLIGGKTMAEWEAEQAAARAAAIEADKALIKIQEQNALIVNYQLGTSKPVAKGGQLVGG